MIAALLLLAEAVSDAPPDAVIEPRVAAQLFVDSCWRGLRNPEIFDAAIAASPLGFKALPTSRPLKRFRAEQADLSYRGGLCGFVVKVKSEADVETFLASLTRRLGVAEPTRGWVTHAFWKAAVQWRDAPIADGVYRWRGTIQHPNPVNDPNGPHVIDITLGFTTWRYPQ